MWIPLSTQSTCSRVVAEALCPTASTEQSRSARSKSLNTSKRSSERGFQSSPSGTTSEHSREKTMNALECLTRCLRLQTTLSSAGDFRVRTSLVLERAKEYSARGAVCGKSSRVLLARYDRDSSSWKIPHSLFTGDLEKFSETFPRYGMMEHGGFYQLPSWVADTSVNVFGVCSSEQTKEIRIYKNNEIYPTPCSSDYKSFGENSSNRDRLDYAIERGRIKKKCYRFPTPRATGMCGGSGAFKLVSDNESLSEEEKRSMQSGSGGKLNPDWVEWLMGWRIGWTDISKSSTRKPTSHEIDPADLDESDPNYIPRLTNVRKNRKMRIETIGNGQVPDCVLAAKIFLFEILGAMDTKHHI